MFLPHPIWFILPRAMVQPNAKIIFCFLQYCWLSKNYQTIYSCVEIFGYLNHKCKSIWHKWWKCANFHFLVKWTGKTSAMFSIPLFCKHTDSKTLYNQWTENLTVLLLSIINFCTDRLISTYNIVQMISCCHIWNQINQLLMFTGFVTFFDMRQMIKSQNLVIPGNKYSKYAFYRLTGFVILQTLKNRRVIIHPFMEKTNWHGYHPYYEHMICHINVEKNIQLAGNSISIQLKHQRTL